MAASAKGFRMRNICFSCFKRQFLLHRSQHTIAAYSEVNDVAEYPPIKPRFPAGNDWGSMSSKVAWLWDSRKQEVAKLASAKDKIDHLTKEAFRTWMFPDVQLQPGMLDYQLNIMKTHMAEGLPELYRNFDIIEDMKQSKAAVQETIEMANNINIDRFKQRRMAKSAEYKVTHNNVKEIISALYASLVSRHEHLLNSQFDDNVNVKAFWDRHGVRRHWPTVRKLDPNYEPQNNSRFQADHNVNFQIRTEGRLPEFYPRNHEMFTSKVLSIPELSYYPTVLGQFTENVQHSVSTGAKLGTPCEFTLLSVLLSDHSYLKKMRVKSGQKYAEESSIGYGIMNSFTSAVAQAYYQGFNTFEELTYPFTTQTIVTDGQYYTFFAYQLNTLHLWLDDEANPLKNVCWVTGPHKLYDTIEDGKIKGFDDTVLEHLVRFLCIKPVDCGIESRPNLTPEDDKVGISEYIERKKLLVEYEEPVQYAPER